MPRWSKVKGRGIEGGSSCGFVDESKVKEIAMLQFVSTVFRKEDTIMS